MKQQINNSNSEYRIYYNNYDPVSYIRIEEGKIVINIRFLTHPKKQRNIEDDISTRVIKEFKENNITLI